MPLEKMVQSVVGVPNVKHSTTTSISQNVLIVKVLITPIWRMVESLRNALLVTRNHYISVQSVIISPNLNLPSVEIATKLTENSTPPENYSCSSVIMKVVKI